MIAEAFDFQNPWFENTGKQPVGDDTLVDVEWSDGDVFTNQPAKGIAWYFSEVVNVTHWRLHKEDKYLEDAYDYGPTNPHGLPKAVCNVPMPPCKPSKPEKTNKVGRLSDEDILLAFNKLTGSNLPEDAYEMLLSLQEMFDSRS